MPAWWKNKYKAPAAFSASNQFLGYITGDANSPDQLVVFNEGYRYVINLTTGYLCPKLSIPYTYGTFADLYETQYRGNDLVFGFNDPSLGASDRPTSWSFVRTTSTGAIPGSILTHVKIWDGVGWTYQSISPEVIGKISLFNFHRWIQVTTIPFTIPFSLPVIITVDY